MTQFEFLTVTLSFVLGLFELTALIANTALINAGVLGSMNLWVVLSIAIILVLVGAKQRGLQGGATVALGLWPGAYKWVFVPATY